MATTPHTRHLLFNLNFKKVATPRLARLWSLLHGLHSGLLLEHAYHSPLSGISCLLHGLCSGLPPCLASPAYGRSGLLCLSASPASSMGYAVASCLSLLITALCLTSPHPSYLSMSSAVAPAHVKSPTVLGHVGSVPPCGAAPRTLSLYCPLSCTSRALSAYFYRLTRYQLGRHTI